ncbi:hypothetical protein DL240_07865 [Lujinxingia litoralis]|uniref:Fibronectin type-III domain-containing protein n=2 Tax=Lujinxingia litoralis TaxID=2211119 RepID=A0A328C806_9DELT|nr:hypothetical protein DL240_07865 [Lujinxingia litoralis]
MFCLGPGVALFLSACPALRPPVVAPAPAAATRLEVSRVSERGLYLRIPPSPTAAPARLRLERQQGDEPATPLYDLVLSEPQQHAWRQGALELLDPQGVARQNLRYTLLTSPQDASAEGWELSASLETSSRALPAPPSTFDVTSTPEGLLLHWQARPAQRTRLMRRALPADPAEGDAPWEPLADLEPAAGARFLDRSARPGQAYAYIAQHVDDRAPAPHFGPFGPPTYAVAPPQSEPPAP